MFTKFKIGHMGVLGISILFFFTYSCLEANKTNTANSGDSSTRSINLYTTDSTGIPTDFGGTCTSLIRETSSCQSAREQLGFTDEWLLFSCNVELGLADASKNAVTTMGSATFVTLKATGLPAHKSNYYPTSNSYSFTANNEIVTGDYSDMYEAYSTSSGNPHLLSQQSYVLYIPLNPVSTTHASKGFGVTGISLDGVAIYNNLAAGDDNIFQEAGSFDECQGHPDAQSRYHYHSEPYALSYQDSKVIGIMRDGYFIYGRYEYGGSTDLDISNTSSDAYIYGGKIGPSPQTGNGNTWRYHAIFAKGCVHRVGMGATVYADDGNFTIDGSNPCNGPTAGGTVVNVYFLSGFGNGGAFATPPTPVDNGGVMINNTTAQRFYWGSVEGDCVGCN